jgi:hypothetical protein
MKQLKETKKGMKESKLFRVTLKVNSYDGEVLWPYLKQGSPKDMQDAMNFQGRIRTQTFM